MNKWATASYAEKEQAKKELASLGLEPDQVDSLVKCFARGEQVSPLEIQLMLTLPPWPVPYRPLNWFSKDDYVSPTWTLPQIKKFYRYFSRAAIWKSVDPERKGIATATEVFEHQR